MKVAINTYENGKILTFFCLEAGASMQEFTERVRIYVQCKYPENPFSLFIENVNGCYISVVVFDINKDVDKQIEVNI